MKIAVVGKGNVGGGLADRWERAGHDVTRFGSEGGDISDAEAVLLAVPGGAVPDAFEKVRGYEGKTFVDATNLFGVEPPTGFESNAQFVKSKTNGPTAKSFNLNFARLYDKVEEQEPPPGNLYAADDEAREATEQLIRDAGYEPVYVGGLDKARVLEEHMALLGAVGPSFYRYWQPG